MLRSVSNRIDEGSPGVCVWEIGRDLPGLCFFSNPSVVQTWAGTDRVDVSVKRLVTLMQAMACAVLMESPYRNRICRPLHTFSLF